MGFAQSYLRDAFPNPDRTGCPSDDALHLMATRPRKGDASVIEHLSCCSPCFNAYMGYLEKAKATNRNIAWVKRSVAAFAVAAALAIVAYLFLAKSRTAPLVAPRNSAPITAPEKPNETRVAVNYVPVFIDLGSSSPTRGSGNTATHIIPPTIPSGSPVALSLRLPLASEEGLYSISLSSGRHVVWMQESQARRERGDTVLQVHADLKDVHAGNYVLQISSSGRHLKVPVVIENPK